MPGWLRRVRGAVLMGLTWAIGWGLVGGLLELLANFIPGLNVVDMWIQTLAIPGFIAGTCFSLVLRVAAGGRKFNELSLPRFGAWGAIGGLLLGGVLFLLTAGAEIHWWRTAVTLGTLTLVSAASAVGTLALARKGDDPPALGDGPGPVALR